MGHCHTPEECGHSRGVWGADRRSAAAFAERGEREAVEAPAATAVGASFAQDRVRPVSVGVRIALYALRFYKSYLSMLFAGSCRFEPTCSRYAYEAIERFGVARGTWLGVKRLLRCHPLSRKLGYDPVPESWESHAV
jgi:uncharacterized protein